MDKPPILSTEQVIKWLKDNYGENAIIAPLAHGKAAQRDADVEWYEERIIETVKQDADRCALYLDSARCEIVNELLSWVDKYRKKYAEEKKECPTDIQRQTNLGGKAKALANVKSKLISILESKVRPEQRRTLAIEKNMELMRSLAEQGKRVAAQQARQDTAREIIEEIEKKWGWVSDKLDKIVIDDYGYWGRENSLKDWQSLKSKYLEAHNSQSGIIRL